MNAAHISCKNSCNVQCETSICDGEIPIVVDSSSLAVEFQCKIVPCPGAGHGGDKDISVVSTCVLKGIWKKAAFAHICGLIGYEVGICDVEDPNVPDSSSSLAVEFPRK